MPSEHLDNGYADWFFDLLDTLKDVIRSDTIINNYQFKSFDIVGNMRIPETSGMPCIRIVPDDDSIRQIETQTRRHGVRVDLYIFDHKPFKGEESYRAHVKMAGRVYDVVTADRTLNCLALDVGPSNVKTIGAFSEVGNNVNFISRIRLLIESDKNE